MNQHVKKIFRIYVGLFAVIVLGLTIAYIAMQMSENDKFKKVEKIEIHDGDTLTNSELKKCYPDIYENNIRLITSITSGFYHKYGVFPDVTNIIGITVNDNFMGEHYIDISYFYEVENETDMYISVHETYKENTQELYALEIDCTDTSYTVVNSIIDAVADNELISGDDSKMGSDIFVYLKCGSEDYQTISSKNGEPVWELQCGYVVSEDDTMRYIVNLRRVGDWMAK